MASFRYEWDAEFAYPRPADFAHLRYDPDLFWTLNPDDPDVNSWGFLGKEIRPEKTPGTYRILFIGDSIMEAGYPNVVGRCLHAEGIANVEVVPLAIGGYSSYQGRVLAEKYGHTLTPDLVIVQFGWNDHWLAFGEPDAEKAFSAPSEGVLAFHRMYDRVRVLQAMGWVWGVALGQGNIITEQMRVSPEAYVENLTAIRAVFAQENIPVWFVTAPSALEQLGVPADLLVRGFVKDATQVLQLHTFYNTLVRDMAGKEVIDIATELENLSTEETRTLFQIDGIHPTRTGTEKIGQRVCEAIQPFRP